MFLPKIMVKTDSISVVIFGVDFFWLDEKNSLNRWNGYHVWGDWLWNRNFH